MLVQVGGGEHQLEEGIVAASAQTHPMYLELAWGLHPDKQAVEDQDANGLRQKQEELQQKQEWRKWRCYSEDPQ